MGSSGSSTPSAGATSAQIKTTNRIDKRIKDLKKEQYYIIDADGNVAVKKKGTAHEVAATYGEKREYLKNGISIHNHPEGGTFSEGDFEEFGFGAVESWVSTPEGTYKMINTRVGKPDQYEGWYDLRNDLEKQHFTDRSYREIQQELENVPRYKAVREQAVKISSEWVKRRSEGASQEELTRIVKRYEEVEAKAKQIRKEEWRRIEVEPYHNWYKKNAKKYGFKYVFIPRGGK